MKVEFEKATFRLGEEGEIFITVRNSGSMGWVELSACIVDNSKWDGLSNFNQLQELILAAIKKQSMARNGLK